MKFSTIVSLAVASSMAILSVKAIPFPGSDCDAQCPMQGAVCARHPDGSLVTYYDPCEVDNINCKNPDKEKIVVVASGITGGTCESVCGDYGLPVCVKLSNGLYETFPSECKFNIEMIVHPTGSEMVDPFNPCPPSS
ncbi:hypothetical protein BGX29_005861 [Mortierella sp. GBA35]|nr:hypothetical protein BGX29_005861 [Mortierella sp. GBA35]